MSCILENGGKEAALENFRAMAEESGSLLPAIILVFCPTCNKQHPLENESYIGGSRSGYSRGTNAPLQFEKGNKQDHTPKDKGMSLQNYFEQE